MQRIPSQFLGITELIMSSQGLSPGHIIIKHMAYLNPVKSERIFTWIPRTSSYLLFNVGFFMLILNYQTMLP